MLLLWSKAIQAGNITYSLQLHPVSGSVGWVGLQFRPQQSELLAVCGAVYQDPAGRGEEQEEEGVKLTTVDGSNTWTSNKATRRILEGTYDKMRIREKMNKWINGSVKNIKHTFFFVMTCSHHSLAEELTSVLIWGVIVKVLYIKATPSTKEMQTDEGTKRFSPWNPSAITST